MRARTNLIVFGSFRIDESAQTMWNGMERLKVTAKALALLQYLVRNAGRVVTKEELLSAVWSDTHVNVGIIKTCVAEIRRALGDSSESPRFIEAIRSRGYRFIASVGVGDLPVPLTSFIGRDYELSRLRQLLEYGRLVTLRGPAGVGKTRLAIEVASRVITGMPCGVWWVDLSTVVDPALVAQTVIITLSIRDYADRSVVQTLADTIRDRRLLLVLDNCEHLIEACTSLADNLLRACPGLKILATSREPLGVAGESVYSLVPLSVPESSELAADVMTSEAVRLFVARAKDATAVFSISDDNASAVANICRRLDGLPLAIELAAGRVNVLAPEQIATRLDDVFGFLGHGGRMESPRHQTLEAAFDWSYELLSSKERHLLACLSIFAGEFTLAAVEAVCSGSEMFDTTELLELMARLVDRSLVTATTDRSASEMRYRLLTTIRLYAQEKLPPHERKELLERHAQFFLHLAEEIAPLINTRFSSRCLVRLDLEHDNLRAALHWATRPEGGSVAVRLTAALWLYWMRRGQLREGRAWLEAALSHGANSATVPALAEALCGAGTLAWLQGDFPYAIRRLEESVNLCRLTQHDIALGRALRHLALPVRLTGDLQATERLVEEAVGVLRCGKSPWDLATALTTLGRVRRAQGRLTEATKLCEEGTTILRSIEDLWTLSYALRELAMIAMAGGELDRAEGHWRESLVALRPLDETWFDWAGIRGLTAIDIARGDYRKAARLAGAADSLVKRTLSPPQSVDPAFDEKIVQLRQELGEGIFGAEWNRGRLLSRNEAIDFALGLSNG